MSRFLYRLGGSAARHPWRVIASWVLVLAAVLGLAGSYGGALNDDYTIPGSESQQAVDLLRERFPAVSGADARAVVHSADGPLDRAALDAATRELARVPHASAVSPPLLSQDGRTALIDIRYDVPVTDLAGDEAVGRLERATGSLRAAGYRVAFGGQVPENVQSPGGAAELIGIGAALVILLLAFGSVVAAGLPIGIALVGVGGGAGLITLAAATTDVATVSPTIASMIGIGAGVDYALFVVTRHRDALARGLSVPDAAAEANATAGLSVVFAGATVLVALAGLQFTGVPNFRSMGWAPGMVVAVTVVAAVTLLPALLGLARMRVYSRRARRTGDLEAAASHSRTAARLARTVARRPVSWLAGSAALLLALGAPGLGMTIGTSDAGNEPTDTTIRQAYDLVEAGFGPGFNGPFLIAVDLDRVGETGLGELRRGLAVTDGVLAVSEPVVAPDGSAAVLNLTPATGPQDEATQRLLDRLRADLPAGVYVGGFTAAMDDFQSILVDNLGMVIGIVLAASFLLMLLAFRSLVVPLKAALVNLLSVGAAYGVLVLVFQTGPGADLMGLPGEAPIAAYVPVLMFAILFGLSMDYEVFLLSRVREEYLRTGDSAASVVAGLSTTARVISSAALIMVSVFLGFAFDPAVVVKMMGIGLATAIAVDATIVRLVLVPATMALLGDWNWYLPRWLDRLLPAFDPHSVAAAGTATLPQQPGERDPAATPGR